MDYLTLLAGWGILEGSVLSLAQNCLLGGLHIQIPAQPSVRQLWVWRDLVSGVRHQPGGEDIWFHISPAVRTLCQKGR